MKIKRNRFTIWWHRAAMWNRLKNGLLAAGVVTALVLAIGLSLGLIWLLGEIFKTGGLPALGGLGLLITFIAGMTVKDWGDD